MEERRPVARGVLSALLLCACGGGAAGGKGARGPEVEPAKLTATPAEGAAGEGRRAQVRVRIYVDADYRAQNPGHETQVRSLMSAAFQVLGPTVGIELGNVEVRPWQREGTNLETALAELENVDPAEDVDWVIGFTGALKGVPTDVHELGYARVLGRHVVVRGLNDTAEVKLLEDVLGGGRREREALYSRRKRHKELVVLLHELGHTLGAMHVTDEAQIMSPSYEASQATFGRENGALMAVTAAGRARSRAEGGSPDAEWRAVLAFIRAHPDAGWNEDEKSALVADLESRVKAEVAGTAGMKLGAGVRPADRERFRAAERLHADGRSADAWAELEPLIEFYPDEPGVHRLACRVAAATGRDRTTIEARCQKAAAAAADDPEPFVRLAQTYQAAKDPARALEAAGRALERLGAGGDHPLAGELASLYQALGAVTWAEKAAGVKHEAVRAWASRTRARYGLDPGARVAPEREAEYVEAVRGLLRLVYDRKFAEAEKRAARLERDYGHTAGIEAALCDLEIRRRKYPAARVRCNAALKRYQDASWAHYLTGLLDKRDKQPAAAVQHLERAIALDPELEHAYEVLAEIHATAGRKADADRVRAAYKTQFGRELP